MIAFVDPPSAMAAVTAFSNAAVVMMSRGFRSSQTMSTMRRPAADAMRGCAESAAGMGGGPGSIIPSASTADVIVDAVPIVMQVPNERAMPSSISRHEHSSSVPARRSAQYFQTSLPEPRIWPRQLPRSMGPAGTTIAGRFALVAPITSAGIVLSQPPRSTAPSAGYERSASSASIASRLRYIIVLGFMNVSPSVSSGISIGKPPACHTPRFTSSARSLKCVWHGLASLQVLRIAITGLPAMSSAPKPACLARERWPNERRSSRPNQRWLRRSVAVLRDRCTRASCQLPRHGLQHRELRLIESRDVGRDGTGVSDARQRGRVMQHARGSPRVAQILERHEQLAKGLGARPVFGSHRLVEVLALAWRETPRAGGHPAESIVTQVNDCRTLAHAADDARALDAAKQSVEVRILRRIAQHDGVLNREGDAVGDQPSDGVESRLL